MGRDQWWGSETYSQHGEDLFFLNTFHLMGIQKPSYIDVGAHHPTKISNTALLYKFGSRGINIEANPFLMKPFDVERPEDKNLTVGIGPEPGIFTFYMIDHFSGRNTFSKEEADLFIKENPQFSITDTMPIPVFTLNDVVKRHAGGFFPDLLCMDIEGQDYDVMKTLNLDNSSPKMICLEIRRGDEQRFKEILYPLFKAFCRLGENVIFIRDDMHRRVCP
jgi:FkbM family methyltransferase